MVLSLVTVMVILFFFMPFPGWPAQKRAIEEINRNCDVPFALAMPEKELQNTSEYVKNEGFGCCDLENDDVSFRLAGYPDTRNEYHIVKYEIKSSKNTLMGLQVGCSLNTAHEILEKNGYMLKDYYYMKNGVGISIFSSDDVVTSFSVFVKTTSILKVVY
jgi:hypothetical protein